MIKEKEVSAINGYLAIGLIFLILLMDLFFFSTFVAGSNISNDNLAFLVLILSLFIMMSALVCLFGFFTVQPNQAKVLQLFGKYKGTVKSEGLHWANPLLTKQGISLRVRNFETSKSKVNDKSGNPIEIAAVVVWSVVDTAEAVFEVNDYNQFVDVQSESALRDLATSYHYDSHNDGEISLRSHGREVAKALGAEIQDRLQSAGVKVHEARITHLAYAPEIAQAMLQRQQAGALIAARTQIVEGAVGMVEMALDRISSADLVELDEDKKASMVSNLLVVLCGDSRVNPVVNTGTLYS